MATFVEGSPVQVADDATVPPAAPFTGASLEAFAFAGGRGRRRARVRIIKASGAGDVTLSGPVRVAVSVDGAWGGIATLNDGSDIVIGDLGHFEVVEWAAMGDAVEIVPAAVAGGGYSAWIDLIGGDGQ